MPQAFVAFSAAPLLALGREGILSRGSGASLGTAAELVCVSSMRLNPNCMGERKDAASGDSIFGDPTLPAHPLRNLKF